MTEVKQHVKKKENNLKSNKLLLSGASSSFCATQANNIHKLLQAVT